MMVDGIRHKVKCRYCHKIVVGGGITRLKQHLAGEKGNVAPCEEVPEEVRSQFRKPLAIKGFYKQKRHEELDTGHTSTSYVDDYNTDYGTKGKENGNEMGAHIRWKKQKKKNYEMTLYVPQPQNQSFTSKEIIDRADTVVAKFMYDAGIPFAASNSRYFQKMADAIAAAGPGYKMPSYDTLSGILLKRNVQEARQQCTELKKCWEKIGCSVLVERWTDRTGRTVINFFVYSSKGTAFLKSVGATDSSQSSESLLCLFNSIVQEVGPDNIVNFVTDTEPSYIAAGKALMAKYGTFFWSACSAHCIDLMLAKIGEMDDVKELLGKAKQVTRFIYNNSFFLNMMKKRAGNRDIIQLGNTKHERTFQTLKSFMSLRESLHEMLTEAGGKTSILSTHKAGVEVTKILEDPHFWSLCDRTLKATEPLLTVLSLLYCEDRPSIGYIYDAVEKAKKSIVLVFNNQESDYVPYLNVIDSVWQEELYSPLHAAGYYLNPSVFYCSRFSTDKINRKGLFDCIEMLEPDVSVQVKITSQISFYEDAVGDFGRPVALRGRESLAPATWWSLYASDYPELQKLAVRILSQACSTTRSQRNWIMFERIQSKKRNRLEDQRLNDLMFVHYNLQLKERQGSSKAWSAINTNSPICLEAMDPDLADWVEESVDCEDCIVMDSATVGELFGSDTCAASVDDHGSSDKFKVNDEDEAV